MRRPAAKPDWVPSTSSCAGAQDKRPDAEKVDELFLWAFARKPTESDLKAALEHVEKHKANKKVAYENILWALINTKEFVFVQ